MTYTQKIDVLDLLINILREHEAKLDKLVSRLEAAAPVDHPPVQDAELSRRFYAPL